MVIFKVAIVYCDCLGQLETLLDLIEELVFVFMHCLLSHVQLLLFLLSFLHRFTEHLGSNMLCHLDFISGAKNLKII